MSDEQLRERFRALRETEMNDAPPFERTLARATTPPAASLVRWLWAPLAAVALALLLVLVQPATPPQPPTLDPGSWTMPTDVLLEVPGTDLLRDLPNIGYGFEGPSSLGPGQNWRTLA